MSEFEDISSAWMRQVAPNGYNPTSVGEHYTLEPLPIPSDAFSTYIAPGPTPVRVEPAVYQATGHTPGELVDDSTFEARVITATRPVLVLFSLPSCGSCHYMKIPGGCWQQALAYYADRYDMYEYVCGSHTQEDKHYDVDVHPTVVAFKGGDDVGVYKGAGRFDYFKDRIDSLNL